MTPPRISALILFGIALFFPDRATAHNPLPGLEGFYVGLLHPLSTPEQALALIATALVLGSFAMPSLLPSFAALILGVLAGMILGQRGIDSTVWLLGLATGSAVWAALFPSRGLKAAVILTIGTGLGIGVASVPEAGPPLDRGVTMAGSFFGALLATLYLTGVQEYLRNRFHFPWLIIGFRVLAAWVAAISIILLAFIAAGPNPNTGDVAEEIQQTGDLSATQ